MDCGMWVEKVNKKGPHPQRDGGVAVVAVCRALSLRPSEAVPEKYSSLLSLTLARTREGWGNGLARALLPRVARGAIRRGGG